MSEQKDYLFHEHYGKVHAFRQGGDTTYFGVWYTRWICSFTNCSQVVLLVKPDKFQRVEVGSNGIVSIYGFTLGEIVKDKKTGRRARIEKFDEVMVWRHRDGRKTRVGTGEYEIITRWIEAATPEGRIADWTYSYDRVKFMKRFRKLEEAS